MRRYLFSGILVILILAALLAVRRQRVPRAQKESVRPEIAETLSDTTNSWPVFIPRIPRPEPVFSEGDRLPGNLAPRLKEKAEPDLIPDEHIVSFKNSRDLREFLEIAGKREGVRVLDVMEFGHSARIHADDPAVWRTLLKDGPEPVEFSSNYYVLVPELPARNPAQPESDYTGFGQESFRWLGVPADHADWGRGVTVAVLDNSIKSSALPPDKLIRASGMAAERVGESAGYEGHGTAVASLLVGNDKDIAGMAPSASLLDIPVLSAEGVGDVFTLARGIVEAVEQGAQVINICLGTYGDSFILRQAVDFATRSGSVIVAAVGNDAVEGLCYPARYDGVLAVSAVDATGRHLFFANRGEEVAISAPGLGVTAVWGKEDLVDFSGTSAAVPFVSGAIAALVFQNPGLSPQDAAQILRQYADDAGAPGPDSMFGAGILNMSRVLERNEKGIYDLAAGMPQIQMDAAGRVTVTVYVQNRGTEPVKVARMVMVVNGQSQQQEFLDLGVGQTLSHSFFLDAVRFKEQSAVDVSCRVVPEGVDDHRPENNASRTVWLLTSP